MSILPLGPGVKVSGASGRKGLGTCRSLDHTLQSWELIKVERQFPSLQRGAPLGLPRYTWATWTQCSTTLALSWAVMLASLRQVVMTRLATLLNWSMVAWMVGV